MPSIHPTASSDIVFISPNFQGVTKDWFKPDYWQEQNQLMTKDAGRGTVWFLDSPKGELILRQYRRGGFIAKFNRFKFLTQGLKLTRPYSELALLETMQQLGLPSPVPVAGMIRRDGIFYEAWLITKVIPKAKDLYEVLQQNVLSEEIWQQIGATIKLFHDKGIYHSDLNCHNIMLDDQNKVWLIDFDKCEQRCGMATRWKQKNLERLKRSFDKENARHSRFEFNDSAWQYLLDGYHHG